MLFCRQFPCGQKITAGFSVDSQFYVFSIFLNYMLELRIHDCCHLSLDFYVLTEVFHGMTVDLSYNAVTNLYILYNILYTVSCKFAIEKAQKQNNYTRVTEFFEK